MQVATHWIAAFGLGCVPPSGLEATPTCAVDADCRDANPCDGDEICVDGACAPGQPVVCPQPDDACWAEDGQATCGPWCDLPRAPALTVLDIDEGLTFVGDGPIEVAAVAPDAQVIAFEPGAFVRPEGSGALRVFARSGAPACEGEVFDLVYDVRQAYPGPAGQPDSEAIAIDDPRIVGWAVGVPAVDWGEDVDEVWRMPDQALGPAEGTSTDIVALGRGGAIVVAIDPPATDGSGPDLAVFENGFGDRFLELGRVSVSTDGATFATFDAAAWTPDPVDAFGFTDPSTVHGLAGVYRQGFGTPFDLSRLQFAEPVRRGFVDLDDIRYVRIDDIVGDGTALDAWGRPIHDPYPTVGSAGFDLDGVAVLAEDPTRR